MKIISKYKDYYDYLKGIYGEDTRLILDRRSSEHPTYYPEGKLVFAIGNLNVDVLHIDGKFYCGESDMIKLNGKRRVDAYTGMVSYEVNYISISDRSFSRPKKSTSYINVMPWGKKRSTDKNDEYAIYLFDTFRNKVCPYPRLEQYGIQKILSPHDIWVELSNWLGQQVTKKEPIVPVGDDKVRIVSAGFDLKTSFRH